LKDHYNLHIITNGFQEVQHIKVQQSGLDNFFNHIITSEAAGAKKPDPIIFIHAFNKTGATASNSVIIGDDLNTDISGAIAMNMKAIYFNPHQKHHKLCIWKEVDNLRDIKKILL
jgi:putative hydrolase of the HAD superfamily